MSVYIFDVCALFDTSRFFPLVIFRVEWFRVVDNSYIVNKFIGFQQTVAAAVAAELFFVALQQSQFPSFHVFAIFAVAEPGSLPLKMPPKKMFNENIPKNIKNLSRHIVCCSGDWLLHKIASPDIN